MQTTGGRSWESVKASLAILVHVGAAVCCENRLKNKIDVGDD